MSLLSGLLPSPAKLAEKFCDAIGLPEPVGNLASMAVNLKTGNWMGVIEDGIDLAENAGVKLNTGVLKDAFDLAAALKKGDYASAIQIGNKLAQELKADGTPWKAVPPPPDKCGFNAGHKLKKLELETPQRTGWTKTSGSTREGSAPAARAESNTRVNVTSKNERTQSAEPAKSTEASKSTESGKSTESTQAGKGAGKENSVSADTKAFLAKSDTDLMKDIQNGNLPKDMSQADMMALQARMNQISMMNTLMTNLMKSLHDMQMAVAQNIRV